MLQFLNIDLREIAVHTAGNKSNDEGLILSEEPINIDVPLTALFLKYFLSAFSNEEEYKFHHDSSLSLNEVYSYCSAIFKKPAELMIQSEHIAQHLYNCMTHPKVQGGDIYIAYFKNIVFNEKKVNAIGIFKSEVKEEYLKVDIAETGSPVQKDAGVNIKKLDKGCLILETEKENGYRILVPDNMNRKAETQYWTDEFLQMRPTNSNFNQTNQFLGLAKAYVTKQLGEDFEFDQPYKIDLLNRSVDYFKSNESFDKDDFEKTVFRDERIIESFNKYNDVYAEQHDMQIEDQFEISNTAVKKQAKAFKSVLKLDKNFHIYIHGDRDLIEHGVDKDGRKFYKIYYQNEVS